MVAYLWTPDLPPDLDGLHCRTIVKAMSTQNAFLLQVKLFESYHGRLFSQFYSTLLPFYQVTVTFNKAHKNAQNDFDGKLYDCLVVWTGKMW